MPGHLLTVLAAKASLKSTDPATVPLRRKMSSQRANELVKAFCELLERKPFIGNTADLPADKATMKIAIETYMVELSVAASSGDTHISFAPTLRLYLDDFHDIDPADLEDVEFYNSFNQIPERYTLSSLRLYTKYNGNAATDIRQSNVK